jgi:hypothetical protein
MAGAGDKFSGFSGRPTGGVPGFFGSKAAVTSTPSSERRLRARRGQTDADQALAALRPLPGARCTFDLEGRHLSRNIGTTAPRLCLVAALAGDRGSPRAGDCKPLLTSVKSLAAPALSIAVARCLITSGKMLDRRISPVAHRSAPHRALSARCARFAQLFSAFIRTCNATFSGSLGYRSRAPLGGSSLRSSVPIMAGSLAIDERRTFRG